MDDKETEEFWAYVGEPWLKYKEGILEAKRRLLKAQKHLSSIEWQRLKNDPMVKELMKRRI